MHYALVPGPRGITRLAGDVDIREMDKLSEQTMRKLRAALFLTLIGIGMAGSLSGCIIEDEDRGGGGGWHHHRDWR
jgi:hypothetical protein